MASGTGGFEIVPENEANSLVGVSSVGLGDVNGDGLADFALSSYPKDQDGLVNVGRNYVVFGRTATTDVSLATIASGTSSLGFAVLGEPEANIYSGSVAAAGDINGDGLADLIVSAPGKDVGPAADAGRSYVVYGKTSGSNINLAAIAAGDASQGFAIDGAAGGDGLSSVSAAGDINGDGFDDLLVGANNADVGANADAGKVYVIFGGSRFMSTVDHLGNSGNNDLTGGTGAETFVGGDGNDKITSGGGADVMYGGKGNDVFVINSSMATALTNAYGAGNNTAQLARIQGGTGIDTLRLSDGMGLDLTAVSNVQMGRSRIESIERIDLLTDTTNNALKLQLNDVLDMGGMNLFKAGVDGWSGTPLTSPVSRHQLVVDGHAGDSVDLVGGNAWTKSGTQVTQKVGDVTQTYDVYNHNTAAAQLLIDSDITYRVL